MRSLYAILGAGFGYNGRPMTGTVYTAEQRRALAAMGIVHWVPRAQAAALLAVAPSAVVIATIAAGADPAPGAASGLAALKASMDGQAGATRAAAPGRPQIAADAGSQRRTAAADVAGAVAGANAAARPDTRTARLQLQGFRHGGAAVLGQLGLPELRRLAQDLALMLGRFCLPGAPDAQPVGLSFHWPPTQRQLGGELAATFAAYVRGLADREQVRLLVLLASPQALGLPAATADDWQTGTLGRVRWWALEDAAQLLSRPALKQQLWQQCRQRGAPVPSGEVPSAAP